MKWFWPVALVAAVVLTPAVARAQTSGATSSKNAGPIVTVWYAGVNTGVTAVDGAGGVFNGEVGMRTWRNLDISVEGGWFQNVASADRNSIADPLVAFLQTTQGQTASAKVKMPVGYAMVNARWVFESERRFRPYLIGGFGGARVSVDTTFSLGGSEINGSLDQYGITLGSDLTGHSSHPAFTFGGGVLIPYGKWYVDAGYRLTSIAADNAINVNRFNIGVGARF